MLILFTPAPAQAATGRNTRRLQQQLPALRCSLRKRSPTPLAGQHMSPPGGGGGGGGGAGAKRPLILMGCLRLQLPECALREMLCVCTPHREDAMTNDGRLKVTLNLAVPFYRVRTDSFMSKMSWPVRWKERSCENLWKRTCCKAGNVQRRGILIFKSTVQLISE